MKKIILSLAVLTSFVAMAYLPGPRHNSFETDLLAYKDAVDNLKVVVDHKQDPTALLKIVKRAGLDLVKWTDRLAQESAGKWDTFESNEWPNPPVNWKCHLECVYQHWRCSTITDGDYLYCMMVYDYCTRGC